MIYRDFLLKLFSQLERSNKRFKARADKLDNRRNELSVHGGWSLGYFEGYVAAQENVLDELSILLNTDWEEGE